MEQRNLGTETDGLSRRNFVRGAAALGLGAGLLGSSSGAGRVSAASGPSRTSYEIMSGTEHETTVHHYKSGVEGPTTMVVGGIHGDEKSGFLAADQIATWSVETGELVVLPRANVTAIAADERPYDDDLNRQFPPSGDGCESELAEAIWDAVADHDPDWVLDLHSSRGIYQSGDGGVGQALFPTMRYPARHFGESAVDHVNHDFDLSGDMRYQMGNTLDADRDMLMHRVSGILNQPGYICETTEKAPLEEQIQWHLYTVEFIMNANDQVRGTPETSDPVQSDVKFMAEKYVLEEYWQNVDFNDYYSHPVLVSSSLSYAGADPAHPRLANVGNQSVDGRVEEWKYLNDKHYEEEAGLLLFDAGVYQSDDGKDIEAGRTHADSDWKYVEFDADFDEAPVVLSGVQSDYNDVPLITRVRNVTSDGFELRLHREDGNSEWYSREMAGWTAFEPGQGTMNGRDYEVGTTTLDEDEQTIDFSDNYGGAVFLAAPMTYNGWNTVTVRYSDLTQSQVDAFLQEERSDDDEMGHVDETVGYFVMEG
ncbi:succinylglutamate desuccinylase/aspartoacylase family protein [Haloarchaeobius sp. DFWS5]|uniref:succinylglutamate desuccinylase/aspartoacylase family protein n=1 Tax=Haloarchaeobius sp. DFWS5 TaxID=3446114 RepID=UPI003EBEA601